YPKKIELLISPVVSNITLIDQPSMESVINRDFPQWSFLPINLEHIESTQYGLFDCVVCSDVIEHLINPDSLLKLIHSITKPSSTIIISTPERDILRGPNCLKSPHKEHVREWNAAEFSNYISQSGLKIIDHQLLPQKKLTKLENLLFKSIKHPKTPRYAGNQMVICKK
ncbi:MAG: class I SAM-dependent methyltransferase, partial [Gammaproteobacteria bacterium]|nr:class I SAM-dependent methyltransferase [Gammaproteobacteria bacterium]